VLLHIILFIIKLARLEGHIYQVILIALLFLTPVIDEFSEWNFCSSSMKTRRYGYGVMVEKKYVGVQYRGGSQVSRVRNCFLGALARPQYQIPPIPKLYVVIRGGAGHIHHLVLFYFGGF